MGRRPDGYHLLESLFWPINFCDEIYLEEDEKPHVQYAWSEDAPLKEISLYQGRETLLGGMLYGQKPFNEFAVQATIKKRIPIGSGLGGISSNVGTVLKFYKELLTKKGIPINTLALELGADVPFFLDPRPSWITGIGENQIPLKISSDLPGQFFFLLVLFPFSSSTPQLFSKYKEAQVPFSPHTSFDIEGTWNQKNLIEFLGTTRNDLEPIAEQEYPVLKHALDCLRSTEPIYCGLSGTGSTCFALFSTSERRSKAAKEFMTNYRYTECKTVFAETF